jgi:hypothetical protein
MRDEHLNTYLNDHLAGSVLALELLGKAQEQNAGTPLEGVLARLHDEIEADQAVLKDVIARLGGGENPVKKAVAWMGEKLARLKTDNAPFQYTDLTRLEELELLLLGVRGKLALWEVLEELAATDERLTGFDFGQLSARAREQLGEIERQRRNAARLAFLVREAEA